MIVISPQTMSLAYNEQYGIRLKIQKRQKRTKSKKENLPTNMLENNTHIIFINK